MKRFVAAAMATLFSLSPLNAKEHLDAEDIVNLLSKYEVEYIYIPPLPVSGTEYHFLMGTTNTKQKQIAINALVKEKYRKLAIMHELYHAYLYEMEAPWHTEEYVDARSRDWCEKVYKKNVCELPKKLEDLIQH